MHGPDRNLNSEFELDLDSNSGFPGQVNSSDFQKGGFSEAEALAVVTMLGALGCDLVEVSGGSYEFAAMMGAAHAGRAHAAGGGVRESTLAREAYFFDFAARARAATASPVMVTVSAPP